MLPRDPYQTKVTEIMESAPVVSLDERATVILSNMGRSPSGSVLVTEPGSNQLVGIVTKGDLVKFEGKDLGQLKVSDVVNRDYVAIVPVATVRQALSVMNGENDLRASLTVIPVVDQKYAIQGVVSKPRLQRFVETMSPAPNKSSLSY